MTKILCLKASVKIRTIASALLVVFFLFGFGVYCRSAFSDYRSEIEDYAEITSPISLVLSRFLTNFKTSSAAKDFDRGKFFESHLAEFVLLDPEVSFYFELIEKSFPKDIFVIGKRDDVLVFLFHDLSVLNILLTGFTSDQLTEIGKCKAITCYFDQFVGKLMVPHLTRGSILFLQVGTGISEKNPDTSPGLNLKTDQYLAHLELLKITRKIRQVRGSAIDDAEYRKVLNEFISFLCTLWI